MEWQKGESGTFGLANECPWPFRGEEKLILVQVSARTARPDSVRYLGHGEEVLKLF